MVSAVIFSLVYFTLSRNANADNILCGGAQSNHCKSQTMSCNSSETCTMQCKSNGGDYACHNSIINCKKSHDCMVKCDACHNITIFAQNATKLDVISTANGAYNFANIYCPNSGECNFKAMPLHAQQPFLGVTILSKTGFNDNSIHFECKSSNCVENARINCTSDYTQSCLINRCDANNTCGTPILNTLYDIPSSHHCKGWELTLSYTVLRYADDELQSLFMNAFVETVLFEANSTWNDKWCYNLNGIQLNNLTFTVNNALYSAHFGNETIRRFMDKLVDYLTANITNLAIESAVYSSNKYDIAFATKGPHGDKKSIVNISLLIIFGACIIGSIYTLYKCQIFENSVIEMHMKEHNKSTVKNDTNQGINDTKQSVATDKKPCKNSDVVIVYNTVDATANNAKHDTDTALPNINTLAVAIEVDRITSNSPSSSDKNELRAQSSTDSEVRTPLKQMDTSREERELGAIFDVVMSEKGGHESELSSDNLYTPNSTHI